MFAKQSAKALVFPFLVRNAAFCAVLLMLLGGIAQASNYSDYYSSSTQSNVFIAQSLGISDGNTVVTFFNDYNASGVLRIFLPQASEQCTVTVTDMDTGKDVATMISTRKEDSYSGKCYLAYLATDQKVNIYISEPDSSALSYYQLLLDYYPDIAPSMTDAEWFELGLQRHYRQIYETAILNILEVNKSIVNDISSMATMIQMADYYHDAATAKNPFDVGSVVVDAVGIMASAEGDLAASNLAAINDGLLTLNSLFLTGDIWGAIETSISNFAQATIYLAGVFQSMEVSKALNAQYMVWDVLHYQHLHNNLTKLSEAELDALTDMLDDDMDDYCSWFSDKVLGCGTDWYSSDVVAALYDYGWSYITTMIEHEKNKGAAYSDIDNDGVPNGQDANPTEPDFNLIRFIGAMTAQKSGPVTPDMYTLTVSTTGDGFGRVTSSPSGVSCGSTCSAAFAEGTMVTLTATPQAGSIFTGWTAGGCTGTGGCVVPMLADNSITASFGQDTSPSSAVVLDTGVTQCYDDDSEINCPSPGEPFYGQDAQYTSAARQPSYTFNGDSTITDNTTGLRWMQTDDGTGRNWETAIDYCEDLDLAGYTDWRLPNIKELSFLVDRSRVNPAIDPVFTCSSSYYWSSTPCAGDTNDAWGVNFSGGSAYSGSKNGYYYVRCVRGGP